MHDRTVADGSHIEALSDASILAREGGAAPADSASDSDASPGPRDASSAVEDGGTAGPTDGAATLDATRDASRAPLDAQVLDSSTRPPEKRCVVFLHGKGGGGGATQERNGYTLVLPTGNADGWGAKQWLYFPDAGLREITAILQTAMTQAACTKVILHGFSNGAAAVTKLYCRGETFGGAVLGYIADDPVPDHGADACKPASGTHFKLYWTGGLMRDAANCVPIDWTCEGNSTVGIDQYAKNLGVPATRSVHTSHTQYDNPPEYSSWF